MTSWLTVTAPASGACSPLGQTARRALSACRRRPASHRSGLSASSQRLGDLVGAGEDPKVVEPLLEPYIHLPGALAARALGELCEIYWAPLYVFLRRSGHAEHDAFDLVQSFCAELLERGAVQARNIIAQAPNTQAFDQVVLTPGTESGTSFSVTGYTRVYARFRDLHECSRECSCCRSV